MLSEALRLIRVFHDLKQTELASRLGLAKSYISEIESGKKKPTMDLIGRYAEEFKIPKSSILFFSEQLELVGVDKPVDDRAKGVIAGKVLNFLRLVEQRTENGA